jgi:pimeloyl-ACP methyl ester carboxylesterase
MSGFQQQVVLIGARKTIVGLVTQPVDYVPGDRPAVVVLNSGIIHRVGHHRMYVVLARMLAEAGHQVLRFDLSGIGDSESRVDGLPPLEAALADVREAVDWLVTARGARRIILVGLCSGADHSLIYGISDPRVCGLVLLDPSIPPTRAYYLRDFLRHLKQPQSWMNVVLGRGRRWTKVRKLFGIADNEPWEGYWSDLGEPAIREFLQDAYKKTMDQRKQCLAVFTSGLAHQHNYREQIFDAFPTVPFADQLQLEYFAGCDHLFTLEADRSRLFNTVMKWTRDTNFARPNPTEQKLEQVVDASSHDRVSYEI